MAAIWGRQRVIVYSPSFLAQLQTNGGGSQWLPIFVMAHELGHHIEGHTIAAGGSNHQTEYEADTWATHALKNMGATLSETTAAMRAMPMPTSGTHPGSNERVANITRVYNDSSRQPFPGQATPLPAPTSSPNPPPPPPVPIPTPSGLMSGTQIEPCSCRWFPGTRGPAPLCLSRQAVAVACPMLFCGVGAPMTAVFCQ